MTLSQAMMICERTKYADLDGNFHGYTEAEIREARRIKKERVESLVGPVTDVLEEIEKQSPLKLTRNAFCSGACGKKLRLPIGTNKKCDDCGGEYV